MTTKKDIERHEADINFNFWLLFICIVVVFVVILILHGFPPQGEWNCTDWEEDVLIGWSYHYKFADGSGGGGGTNFCKDYDNFEECMNKYNEALDIYGRSNVNFVYG